ncbi:MAG: tRNA pseudouridine synthase A [Bacteroidales bacterium]|nr:tRNA pseudouridine synthase A [Bacteroidales bacterium]
MRYKITLSYSGAGFFGWQVQPDRLSVQEVLEKGLSTLLRTAVSVTGAGRTDTGVNAIGYVAHFDAPDPVDCTQLCYKLNAILPRSVVALDICPAPDGFHARFDASQREYTYFLHTVKDPFASSYSYQCGYRLDFEAMNRAAGLLAGRHGFSCFEKLGTDTKTSVCTVREAFWHPYTPILTPRSINLGRVSRSSGPAEYRGDAVPDEGLHGLTGYGGDVVPTGGSRDGNTDGEYWYFRISADRFLRNMVRAVVGTLLEVGRGRRDMDSFAALILPPDTPADADGCRRSLAGESVPGHALFLSGVDYPEE